MSEVEVGEYVRTKNQGIKRIDTIFKNKTVNKYGYEIGSEWDGKLYSYIKTTDILKHSKNIIDLIEVGDFVNGYRVIEFKKSNIRDSGIQILVYRNHQYEQWETIFENEIKNILTKEQYNQNCYRLEE